MRKTEAKIRINQNEKGITLIALVITIIVLLILAGVAISMLSGENGILKQAAEAKTEHENAQIEEEKALVDMEVELDFVSSKTPYKFHNGYITGIKMISKEDTEFVGQAKLPTGYEIYIDENTKVKDEEKDTLNIKTGMIVKKNGKTIGTIIVFGDFNMDGHINIFDAGEAINIFTIVDGSYKECQLVAMNVNQDKYLNMDDVNMISAHESGETKINQSVEVKNDIKDIVLLNKEWYIHNYINERPEGFVEKYKVYYNENNMRYDIDIEAGTLTASGFLEDLQDENAKFKTFSEETGKLVEAYDNTPISRVGRVYIQLGEWGEYEVIRINVK